MKETERFTGRANAYSLYRPSYPDAVIDAVLSDIPMPATVADLGAGTGISSNLLARKDVRVTAVEPNGAMRREALPNSRVTWRDGTGEATGLPDHSVDVVTAFQAFHWFATEHALHEFYRIARRRIAIVQYERDETDPFTKAYGDIVGKYALDDTEQRRLRALDFFRQSANPNPREIHHRTEQRLDCEGLLGRAASSSYLPQSGPSGSALRSDIAALFQRSAPSGTVGMAMKISVLLCDLA